MAVATLACLSSANSIGDANGHDHVRNPMVKWTILPQEPPQPLLHCKRCSGTRSYKSSGKFRVNANGKQVDPWLIYKCISCDSTWKRPILARTNVRLIDRFLLESLSANDAKLANRLAFDAGDLEHWARQMQEGTTAVVTKEALSGSIAQPRELHILCIVPYPTALRLDRLLAEELQLSRSRIQTLEKSEVLVTSPSASHPLRKSVRDGMELRIKLPVQDADWITTVGSTGLAACCGTAKRSVNLADCTNVVRQMNDTCDLTVHSGCAILRDLQRIPPGKCFARQVISE